MHWKSGARWLLSLHEKQSRYLKIIYFYIPCCSYIHYILRQYRVLQNKQKNPGAVGPHFTLKWLGSAWSCLVLMRNDQKQFPDTRGYFIVIEPMHRSSSSILLVAPLFETTCIQCTMGLPLLGNCFREICSFAPIFQGYNCFRVIYLEYNFHSWYIFGDKLKRGNSS